MNEKREFENKVAIVFGASRGIGAAAARGFARRGAAVVLAARGLGALEEVAGTIDSEGGSAAVVQCDVTEPEQVESVVDTALSRFGRLDMAFNNAGGNLAYARLAETSVEDFDRTLQVNVRGTFLAMRFEIPAMLDDGGGAIVNTASTAGLQSATGIGAYATAKHGVLGLTKTAALDYAQQNVRVNALAPGAVMTDEFLRGGQRAIDGATAATPMRRIGSPEEVAAAALWLCSSEASFVTGETLVVDGGRLAGAG
jgi:NAD(P)-dependent dehydrogenase (short-subunit alcohol dehydrogenase family)